MLVFFLHQSGTTQGILIYHEQKISSFPNKEMKNPNFFFSNNRKERKLWRMNKMITCLSPKITWSILQWAQNILVWNLAGRSLFFFPWMDWIFNRWSPSWSPLRANIYFCPSKRTYTLFIKSVQKTWGLSLQNCNKKREDDNGRKEYKFKKKEKKWRCPLSIYTHTHIYI